MNFNIFLAPVFCPHCKRSFGMSGMTDYCEPELHTKQCPSCGKLMAIRRDPATGRLTAEEMKPS